MYYILHLFIDSALPEVKEIDSCIVEVIIRQMQIKLENKETSWN